MGLTQEQLSEIMCVPKSTISAYENDKVDVKGSIVMELAFYLATSPNYLLGYDDEMPGDNELIRTVISLIKTIKDEKVLSLLAGQIKVAAELYS
jgi:transcriptional regulator with XRE-family HTH domain